MSRTPRHMYQSPNGRWALYKGGALRPDGTLFIFRRSEIATEGKAESIWQSFVEDQEIIQACLSDKHVGYTPITYQTALQELNTVCKNNTRWNKTRCCFQRVVKNRETRWLNEISIANIRLEMETSLNRHEKEGVNGALTFLKSIGKIRKDFPGLYYSNHSPRLTPLPNEPNKEETLLIKNRLEILAQDKEYRHYSLAIFFSCFFNSNNLAICDLLRMVIKNAQYPFVEVGPVLPHRLTWKRENFAKSWANIQKMSEGKPENGWMFSKDPEGLKQLSDKKCVSWLTKIEMELIGKQYRALSIKKVWRKYATT